VIGGLRALAKLEPDADSRKILGEKLSDSSSSVRGMAVWVIGKEAYERLGIPTVATIRWAADRMMRHLVPEGTVEVFRDPTSAVSIVEAPLHRDWVGRTIKALEDGTGARVAYLMRFGIGSLATASTVLQDGDQVFVVVTDDIVENVLTAAAGAEPGGH